LSHENIIKLLGSEINNEELFLYMEYVSGGSLRSLLDIFGGFNEKLIQKYLSQILQGLKYLHNLGIIHRDLKCANILLDPSGKVKISDFGCSKQIISQSKNELLQSLKGTLPWMAPEVVCQNKYDMKADIWSLGCLVLEMLTAKIPWGKMENYMQAILKIGRTNNTPDIPDNISINLKDFIQQCLCRDPLQRKTVDELLMHPFILY
jgi:serine/threonine protein kinase